VSQIADFINATMTELIFVDPGAGVKLNRQYYRDFLLSQKMLPAIIGYRCPAYRARDTIQLLQQKTPNFIDPDLWPPICVL